MFPSSVPAAIKRVAFFLKLLGMPMKRRSVDELRQELQNLMQERVEALKKREFLPATREQFQNEEDLLTRIREVSADYLVAMRRHLAHPKPKGESMTERPSVTLPGKVDKIIEPAEPGAPETAQISVESADPLYRELRIENTLKDSQGEEVHMKEHANVDVTIEAHKDPTSSDGKNKEVGKKD
jgi:hypothetical protein